MITRLVSFIKNDKIISVLVRVSDKSEEQIANSYDKDLYFEIPDIFEGDSFELLKKYSGGVKFFRPKIGNSETTGSVAYLNSHRFYHFLKLKNRRNISEEYTDVIFEYYPLLFTYVSEHPGLNYDTLETLDDANFKVFGENKASDGNAAALVKNVFVFNLRGIFEGDTWEDLLAKSIIGTKSRYEKKFFFGVSIYVPEPLGITEYLSASNFESISKLDYNYSMAEKRSAKHLDFKIDDDKVTPYKYANEVSINPDLRGKLSLIINEELITEEQLKNSWIVID